MALTIQPIDLGDNFRTWRDRFNVLVGYMNHTLQDTNNLSDLLNKAVARTNLDVWSKAEATTLFLDTASNLSEINANGESAREAARVNIDVWSRTQADARYYEESKFLSEIAGAPNAANRDTMHTNIDVYKRGVLYTRTEADDRYFQANTDSVTPVPDTDILDYKRDGTYSAIVHPVAGGAANGTVISLSPIGSGRYQIYAPQKESVVDVLNGTVYGDKSAMYIRNGWGAALTGWERLLSTSMGDATYFRKNQLLNELTGAARNTDRRTLTDNIDVYQKGDVFNKTESDSNYYRKTVVWTRTESDARFNQVSNYLSEILAAGTAAQATARTNLSVYSKAEADTNYYYKSVLYTKTESDARFMKVSNILSEISTAGAGAQLTARTNLSVYSKAENDAAYYAKSLVWTKTESDSRFMQVSNILSEISTAGTTAQATARTNLSVYSKAENDAAYYVKSLLYTKTEEDARFMKVANNLSEISTAGVAAQLAARTNLSVYSKAENDSNYYIKNLLWTRTEADSRFMKVSNNLSEISTAGAAAQLAARTSLNVYSKAETDTRYINDDRDNMFSEVAGSINMSDIQRDKMLENLGVYSRAVIDANYQTGATTYLAKNMNLADVADKNAGRNNLGLGNSATSNFATGSDIRTWAGVSTSIARSDHRHSAIEFFDTRATNPLPNATLIPKGKTFEFKDRGVMLGSGTGTYVGLETTMIWTDYNDAYRPYQTLYDASSANGRVYHRVAASATVWGAWNTVAYLTDTVAGATTLNGQSASYYLDWNNVTNKPSIAPLVHNHDTAYLGITANAVSATKLATARTIAITGAVTGTATSFDGTANISIATTALNASNLSAGTVPDARISGTYTGLTNLTGTGIVDFSRFFGNSTDLVSAPSFSWTTDTDTGIYTPAADQLAITTGGVQRALFNSSGVTATTFIGALSGNATSATTAAAATKLVTTRAINGTNFDGTAAITTSLWGTDRTLTVGATGKSVNGSANITWSLAEIGAAAASHTHAYLPLTGGALTGTLQAKSIGFDYSNMNVIKNPQGAAVKLAVASTVGFIKVTLPQLWTDTMMSMVIRVYEYDTDKSFDLHVGGYNNVSGSIWVNTFAYITSNSSGVNHTIRFGHDGTKACIYIGESNTDWSHPACYVSEILVSHSNYAISQWDSGWSIGVTPTLGTISATQANVVVGRHLDSAQVLSASNYMGILDSRYVNKTGDTLTGTLTGTTFVGAFSGNATTATTLQTARTINGVSFNGSANITVADSTKLPLTGGTLTGTLTGTTFVGALSGNAASATKLATARTIAITGAVTGTATSFDGTANISIATTALNASNLSAGTIPDARISGSYTGLTNLTGTGIVDFSRFFGNTTDLVSAPSFSWTTDTDTGIYSPAADQLAITTGGVQRALFNSSGVTATTFIGALSGNATSATTATNAVGILSTGAVVTLQTSAVGGYFNFTSSGVSIAAGVRVGSLIATASYSNTPPPIGQISATQFNGELNGNATSATTAANATKLVTTRAINGTNFDGTAAITTALWGTARTLTVGSTGKSVNGSANIAWSLAEIGAAAASHTHAYLPLTGGTLTGALAGTTATFTTVTGTSDRTLKTNIETIKNPLETVKQLRGVSYDWIDSGKSDVGVIAQEVQEVIPEVVHEDDKGMLSVDYSHLVGHLIEAIKALEARVAELEAK